MAVQVKRIPLDTEHDNQKWLVLEGSIDGCPAVTKRTAMNTAALASIPGHYEEKKAKLIADVEEYYARYLAVQEQLKAL